jgi:hypothetical protein
VTWSCRFAKVADPEPSAFTVTESVLDVAVRGTNSSPPAARETVNVDSSVYVPGPAYVSTSQVSRKEEPELSGRYQTEGCVPALMPDWANAAHAGRPEMFWVKLAD